MRLRVPQIVVPPQDPFANCLFGRKTIGESLSEFVLSLTDESAVLAVNGRWGSGKSTFLRMWEAELQRRRVPHLHFNAWQNDFTENPLIALIGEIGAGITALLPKKKHSGVRSALKRMGEIGA